MKRLWVVALSIALGGLFGYYYSTRSNAAEVGEFDNVTAWQPSSAMVRKQVALLPVQGTTAEPDERHKQLLGDLLTSRFRNHEPQIAMRVKFDHAGPQNKDIIKLMCPARMEPWNMDWLAVKTWREVKEDFGRGYDMDIYITYIGLSQIKVAELRPVPGQPDQVHIHYRTPEEVRQEMMGKSTPSLAHRPTR
jgi:hypothetical protein